MNDIWQINIDDLGHAPGPLIKITSKEFGAVLPFWSLSNLDGAENYSYGSSANSIRVQYAWFDGLLEEECPLLHPVDNYCHEDGTPLSKEEKRNVWDQSLVPREWDDFDLEELERVAKWALY